MVAQSLISLYGNPTAANFHRYLNWRRGYVMSLSHGAPPLRGWHQGDGVPRTAAGYEFEPLSRRVGI
ncbi:hypothetical protein JS532_08470 [Bifidobacterium callimiconis]|uniref:hypothetical protein n=1 Tax=Bifidobacterium callimiconis TaxID=2306973 RepID=UPI001BDBE6B5|nr:hypothetical protein [Bifidobacterium callimiconis]MBT1177594.1 hypothetical protein [Bifidobacterium callimiconis]